MNGTARGRPKPPDRPRSQVSGSQSSYGSRRDSQVSIQRPICAEAGICTVCIELISYLPGMISKKRSWLWQGCSDSFAILGRFTDGNQSYSLQQPLQMQRFLGAALTHCKNYPNDVAYVLHCLGSQNTAGLQRLREVSCYPHAITVQSLLS